ncbi:Pol polyprotein, partial [Mucuna pruriens]
MTNTTYGIILIFRDSTMIKSLVGVFQNPRSNRSSNFVTQHLEAVTMDQLRQPGKDAYQFVSTCKQCQKVGMAISRMHEMPQQPNLFCEVFNIWGIDFMGPFPIYNGYSYILVVVDYVPRWVEAIATKTNDGKVVVNFLKSNIFCRFSVPKVLVSDQRSHFYSKAMPSLLGKYRVVHQIATAYHP